MTSRCICSRAIFTHFFGIIQDADSGDDEPEKDTKGKPKKKGKKRVKKAKKAESQAKKAKAATEETDATLVHDSAEATDPLDQFDDVPLAELSTPDAVDESAAPKKGGKKGKRW